MTVTTCRRVMVMSYLWCVNGRKSICMYWDHKSANLNGLIELAFLQKRLTGPSNEHKNSKTT